VSAGSGGRGGEWMRRLSRFGGGAWVPVFAILLGVGGPLVGTWQMVGGVSRGAPVRAAAGATPAPAGGVNAPDAETAEVARRNSNGQRMQASVALAVSASLRLARERAQGRIPADALALYQGMVADRIYPPTLTRPLSGSSASGVVVGSEDGRFLLRYDPVRFGVEVVSVGLNTGAGEPPMMVRVPDDPDVFGDAPGFYTKVVAAAGAPGCDGTDAAAVLRCVAPAAFADRVMMAGGGWRVSALPVDARAISGRVK
jgi:hypothetical protein